MFLSNHRCCKNYSQCCILKFCLGLWVYYTRLKNTLTYIFICRFFIYNVKSCFTLYEYITIKTKQKLKNVKVFRLNIYLSLLWLPYIQNCLHFPQTFAFQFRSKAKETKCWPTLIFLSFDMQLSLFFLSISFISIIFRMHQNTFLKYMQYVNLVYRIC